LGGAKGQATPNFFGQNLRANGQANQAFVALFYQQTHPSLATLLPPFSSLMGILQLPLLLLSWVLILFLISSVQTKLGVISATPNFFFLCLFV
jgi:hypothetical protein